VILAGCALTPSVVGDGACEGAAVVVEADGMVDVADDVPAVAEDVAEVVPDLAVSEPAVPEQPASARAATTASAARGRCV